jgi:hypothetical protein
VSFVGYVEDGEPGAELLGVDDLGPYVTSVEFTRTTDPMISEAQAALRELRRVVGSITDSGDLSSETASTFSKAIDQLSLRQLSGSGKLIEGLQQRVEDLRRLGADLRPTGWADRRDTWLTAVATPMSEIDQALSELRRRANVGTAT